MLGGRFRRSDYSLRSLFPCLLGLCGYRSYCSGLHRCIPVMTQERAMYIPLAVSQVVSDVLVAYASLVDIRP